MDLLAVDVTELPDGAVRRGDLVTLIGDEHRASTNSRRAGHNRLRGADQPRAALSPRLQGLRTCTRGWPPILFWMLSRELGRVSMDIRR